MIIGTAAQSRLDMRGVALSAAWGGTPNHVSAGVPLTVRDTHGIQICISSRDGRPIAPFIIPLATARGIAHIRLDTQIHPGVPFVLRDGYGALVCLSSEAGQALAQFIQL